MNEIRSKGKCMCGCVWMELSVVCFALQTLCPIQTRTKWKREHVNWVSVRASKSVIVVEAARIHSLLLQLSLHTVANRHKHIHTCECARALSLLEFHFKLSSFFNSFFFHSRHHRVCAKIPFYLFIIVISLGSSLSFCLLLYYSGKSAVSVTLMRLSLSSHAW